MTDELPPPLAAFEAWRAEAAPFEPDPFTPMVVATASSDGVPSARTVLLKGVDRRGFVFFTNRLSRKAREVADNPRASLVLRFREPRHRQVLVSGTVEEVPATESDAYFATRPRGSQLGAWASPQSEVIEGRHVLEALVAAYAERWPPGTPVPRPPHWGGYVVRPDEVELWEGRDDRLHDRLRWRRDTAGGWFSEHLAP